MCELVGNEQLTDYILIGIAFTDEPRNEREDTVLEGCEHAARKDFVQRIDRCNLPQKAIRISTEDMKSILSL
jgi:hypothetical protein